VGFFAGGAAFAVEVVEVVAEAAGVGEASLVRLAAARWQERVHKESIRLGTGTTHDQKHQGETEKTRYVNLLQLAIGLQQY
jgi:hypothetical protein